tara:strand:+ start:314 stop:838 length:525 start_codon:yes stop_codon:yes gene_type:complete
MKIDILSVKTWAAIAGAITLILAITSMMPSEWGIILGMPLKSEPSITSYSDDVVSVDIASYKEEVAVMNGTSPPKCSEIAIGGVSDCIYKDFDYGKAFDTAQYGYGENVSYYQASGDRLICNYEVEMRINEQKKKEYCQEPDDPDMVLVDCNPFDDIHTLLGCFDMETDEWMDG